MTLLETLNTETLRELLIKNWMTHDALWFYHTLQACGIEQTNAVNRAAVRGMAAVEAKRIMKLWGKKELKDFAELRRFFTDGLAVIRGDFMDFHLSFPEENVMVWDIPRCFAHDGVAALGVIERYECGIIERARGWLDALKIGYTLDPEPGVCMMPGKGRCRWTFRFTW